LEIKNVDEFKNYEDFVNPVDKFNFL